MEMERNRVLQNYSTYLNTCAYKQLKLIESIIQSLLLFLKNAYLQNPLMYWLFPKSNKELNSIQKQACSF